MLTIQIQIIYIWCFSNFAGFIVGSHVIPHLLAEVVLTQLNEVDFISLKII